MTLPLDIAEVGEHGEHYLAREVSFVVEVDLNFLEAVAVNSPTHRANRQSPRSGDEPDEGLCRVFLKFFFYWLNAALPIRRSSLVKATQSF